MATVNFSVPEEVKRAFNKTFSRQNKSQIIAHLMEQAIEEERAKRQRSKAIDTLLKLRASQKTVSLAEILAAKEADRR